MSPTLLLLALFGAAQDSAPVTIVRDGKEEVSVVVVDDSYRDNRSEPTRIAK